MNKINPIQLRGEATLLETRIRSVLDIHREDIESTYIYGGCLTADTIFDLPYLTMSICLVKIYNENKNSDKINSFLSKYWVFKNLSMQELNNNNEVDLKEMINEFKNLITEFANTNK